MVAESKESGNIIEVITPKYEAGKPTDVEMGCWAAKLATRKEILKYLESAEGYEQDSAEQSG